MTALWGRKWHIYVAKKDDSIAYDVSNLRCVFEVHRKRETSNFATISIYNLTEETERSIIMECDRLVIEAGYSASEESYSVTPNGMENTSTPVQYGKIFDGEIIYPTRHKENNTDYVLTLLCVDGDDKLCKGWVNQSVRRGLNQRKIVETVCNKGEIQIPIAKISPDLNPQILPRGKVFFGEPIDYLHDVLRGNAATFWWENDGLTVAKYTDVADDEALVFTPSTGLIGMPQQTQLGAQWTLLLNPQIKMGLKCKLSQSEMAEYQAQPGQIFAPIDDEWIYQVIEITHRGDTWGNEWYTECQGVARTGNSLLAMMATAKVNPR